MCPKTGLEPVIALLEGKCLNHLNYSGSYNCCTRLLGKEVYIRSVGASNGTRTRAVCLASRNTNRLYYTCIWVREPAEPLAHLICIYLERDSQVYPLEAIFRIELKTKGYKALVLPLNYIAKLVSRGFEPLNAYYYAIMRAR